MIRTKRLSLVGLSLAIFFMVGCKSRPQEENRTVEIEKPKAAAPNAEKAPELFGEKLRGENRTSLKAVIEKPETFKAGPIVVEGEVRRACSKKGCWMELATASDESAPGCRVTFKDYGFFVPTNSAGSHALVEGIVEITIVPKARVDHLEAEGARFQSKNPDGTANEVRLVATGVELSRRS